MTCHSQGGGRAGARVGGGLTVPTTGCAGAEANARGKKCTCTQAAQAAAERQGGAVDGQAGQVERHNQREQRSHAPPLRCWEVRHALRRHDLTAAASEYE